MLLTFDVETTGLDPVKDRVVQLALKVDNGDVITHNFNPGIPIPPDASAVHGISDNDVKDCPRFTELAEALLPLFQQADVWMGYNCTFDIGFLTEEFARAGLEFPKPGTKLIVDPFTMWQSLERRSLANAYKRYVNEAGFDNAHTAGADVQATYDVLRHMLVKHQLDERDWEQLADLSNPDRHRELGCKHFLWNDTGTDVVYGFGKHKGVSVFKETGYLKWMANTDFDKPVKTALGVIIKACRQPDKIAAIKLVYPFRKADK